MGREGAFYSCFEEGVRKLFQGLNQPFGLVWWTRNERQSVIKPKNNVSMSCMKWNCGL